MPGNLAKYDIFHSLYYHGINYDGDFEMPVIHGTDELPERLVRFSDAAAGLSERYGGRPRDWKHVKGLGTIEAGGRFRTAEVHWFEERGAGRVEFKVKRWLD